MAAEAVSPRSGVLVASPPPTRGALAPSSPLGTPTAVRKDDEDAHLFAAPTDLVCPLTLAVFLDPVLTTAGHVYELGAIQKHLERSATDPLTRQPLLNKSLTPVYVLRSRALEYRESTARACVARVCSGTTAQPARYLRRAVELIVDTGSTVQGLSRECVEYVLAHPSNAYDQLALELFAQGLFASGYRDRAAAIWSSLLLEDPDRGQQAELLRRCLGCWTDDPSTALASGDDYVFDKLVALFEGRPLGWDALVELAEDAGLGHTFVLRLCEQLLFRRVPPPVPGSRGSSPRGGGGAGGPASVSFQEKRLLWKFCSVLTSSLQQRQTEAERRLQELERWRRRRSGSHRSSGSLLSEEGSPRRSPGHPPHLPGWLRHPALVGACMLLTVAVPPDHLAGRALRVVPLFALLPAS